MQQPNPTLCSGAIAAGVRHMSAWASGVVVNIARVSRVGALHAVAAAAVIVIAVK